MHDPAPLWPRPWVSFATLPVASRLACGWTREPAATTRLSERLKQRVNLAKSPKSDHGKSPRGWFCCAADCYKRRITKHARPKEYPKYSQACHTCHTRLCTAHGVFSDSRDSTRTEKLTKHAERRLCCCAQRATSGGLLGDTPAHSATHERAKPTGRRSISNLF